LRSSASSAGLFTTVSESSRASVLLIVTAGCAAQKRCTKYRSALRESVER
jgi:hypothetical protein